MTAPSSAREDDSTFTVPATFTLPDLADLGHGVTSSAAEPPQTLRTTYHDSPDLRLARAGITLRHRSGSGTPDWTLALPAGIAGGEGAPAEVIATPGPLREVPAELRRLLPAWLRGAELGPMASLRTERSRLVLCGAHGEELVALVDDTTAVLEGRRVLERFREVRVEPSGLSPEARALLRLRLLEAGAGDADPLPPLVRALGPRAVAPPDLPPAAAVRRSDPAAALVTAAIRTGTRRLLSADVGVRRGQEDAVHRMRVACRRLRSDLRTFRSLVEPRWGRALRAELAWLADALGEARDLEVLRRRLRAVVDAEPTLRYDVGAYDRLDDVLARREQSALAAAAEALDADRYRRLLDVLLDAAAAPVLTEKAQRRCSKALPPLLDAAWSALAKRADHLRPDDPDDAWHAARVKAKQARYAADTVREVLGSPAARMAAAAKTVQEALGDHQDGAVAAETLAGLAAAAAEDGPLCFVAGRLAEWNRGDVARVRREFPAVWAASRQSARRAASRRSAR